MKKIFQTKTGLGQGNCLAACIASLLHLDIEDIPNYGSVHNAALVRYLAEKGYCLIQVEYHSNNYIIYPDFFILIGESPRHEGRCNHAVVATMESGFMEIVHDPYPSDTESHLLSYDYVVFIGAKV